MDQPSEHRPGLRPKRGATRRSVMIGGAAAAITVALPPPLLAQRTTIVSTIFGGAFEAAYRKHVVEPF